MGVILILQPFVEKSFRNVIKKFKLKFRRENSTLTNSIKLRVKKFKDTDTDLLNVKVVQTIM